MGRTNAQDREEIIQLGVRPFLIGKTENQLLTNMQSPPYLALSALFTTFRAVRVEQKRLENERKLHSTET